MHKDTTKEFASIAVEKIDYLKRNPLGYFISTMMAGAYVGVGIILIFTLGNDADPASRNLAWVSLGNVIGGAGFIGVAYYLTGHSLTQR